ncbi:helix-turn-helix transcriptional regulator [Kitasatospora sp. NPDC094016]|uniref:helix-turn-helix domain-containing protein n=1 Tax=Kitasatospora sp. NPDC094016 TaxID=3154986 RepID=UPI003331A8A3
MDRHHAPYTTSPAPAEELARELRSLKSESGLTYARISERTHYAKSSWERWVNGKQFPPRDAVESIASVCAGDADRLLDLWRRADGCRAAGTPAGALPDTAVPPAPGPAGAARSGCRQHHGHRTGLLRPLVALVLMLAAGLVLAVTGRWPSRPDRTVG